MLKRRFFSFIILLLVLGSFMVYECAWMFAGADEMASTMSLLGTTSLFPIILLFFSILYSWRYKVHSLRPIYGSFLLFFVLSYILTVFWAFLFPIESRIVFISTLLPFVFWTLGDKMCAQKGREFVSVYVPFCFMGLVLFFFLKFDASFLLDKEYAAINASYSVLYFMPFLLISEKRMIRLLAIILTAMVTIASLKRGGMVSLSMGILAYLWAYSKVVSGRAISVRGIIIVAIVVVALAIVVIRINDSVDGMIFNRFSSLENDEGSGRKDIYKGVINMIANSSPIGLLFGHGWGGVARDSSFGLSAHNDFLEVIYDFGLIVFFCYILFLYRLIVRMIYMLRYNQRSAPAFLASITIFLLNSLVSHIVIYPWYMIMFTLFWSYTVHESVQSNSSTVVLSNENRPACISICR